jgi:hypothetical protein
MEVVRVAVFIALSSFGTYYWLRIIFGGLVVTVIDFDVILVMCFDWFVGIYVIVFFFFFFQSMMSVH